MQEHVGDECLEPLALGHLCRHQRPAGDEGFRVADQRQVQQEHRDVDEDEDEA
jgi:hypothetical protein